MGGLHHRHIIGVVEREAGIRGIKDPAILDAGCGDGALLSLFSRAFLGSSSGFDSADYGLQARERIGSEGGKDAEIRVTNLDGSWPFADSEFDIVVSNQVLEHVRDLPTFCAENARVLRPGGFGVHVFPLKRIAIEPHMLLPLVHRVRDHDLRTRLIAWFSRIGLGIYRSQGPAAGVSLDDFARSHADYARTFTSYRTWRIVCDEYHRQGCRVSYRHTSTLVQRGLTRLYGHEKPGHVLPSVVEAALFPLVTLFASCTLIVEKDQEYRFNWKAPE